MAEVTLTGVSKRFGQIQAVGNVSLHAPDGSFIVLLGPTGAGKTTLLRLVAGLETPESGSITIGGRDVTAAPPAARDVTFVFQQYSLYPHLSVYDNLAFPLRSPARRVPETDIATIVNEIARVLRIEDKLQNRATQLSGGQMQRVAIGRALVRRPAVYLMDEPLSSLDAKLRSELRVELKRIQQDLGATILYVTHDQTEAMTLATCIGVLDQGVLVQVGTPREIYQNPVSTYVATRLGSPGVNLMPRAIFPDLPLAAQITTIGARTEHLKVSRGDTKGHIGGRVQRIEHLGDQNHLHLRLGDANRAPVDVVTLVSPDSGLAMGDAVTVELVRPLYFDQSGNRVTE